MPRNTHKHTRLNPVAHSLEDIELPESQDQTLFVNETGTASILTLNVNVPHPESVYVVRFEQEMSQSPAVSKDVIVPTIDLEEPAEHVVASDLFVAPLELSHQIRPMTRIRRPWRVRTNVAVLPVVDYATEDTVQALAASLLDELDPWETVKETLQPVVDVAEEVAGTEGDDDTPLFDDLLGMAQEEEVIEALTPQVEEPAPPRFTLVFGQLRTVGIFMGLALLVAAPIHAISTFNKVSAAEGTVKEQGVLALGAITSGAAATGQKDFAGAGQNFETAASTFLQAQDELSEANTQLLGMARLLPNTGRQVKQAQHLLAAGASVAQAASIVSQGMEALATRTTKAPTAAVSLFDVYAEDALPELQNATEYLDSINPSYLPVEYRGQVKHIRELVSSLSESMEAFHTSSDAIASLLGDGQRQRYLILFQNHTELRPTGGFWGSLAEVDIVDGELRRMEIPGGGTYFGQGQLSEDVAAPAPLQLLKARWELQDANWFPDFPTSAQQGMALYEASGGPSVDGVIAVNASLVADLIDATGAIELPEYGVTIDGENFLFQVQKQVEHEYDRTENRPKAIIGDMAPILIERMTSSEGDTFLQMASLLSRGLAEREIQIYHTNPDIQSALSHLGWTGELLGNTGDYLHVSHTNIGGGKTDGVIDDEITVESTLRPDGRIENVVEIARTHHGLASSTFSGSNNVSFTRIFVPRGSELLSVNGAQPPEEELFESIENVNANTELERIEPTTIDPGTGALIAESLGKTSFGHWLQTRPGSTSTLTFRYVLPEDILNEPPDDLLHRTAKLIGIPQTVQHSMQIQKQSGVERRETHYTFFSNTSLKPVWTTEDTSLELHLDRNTDGYFGMIMEQ